MKIPITDQGILQLLVSCPMRQLLITVPECQACPYHGGTTKERHHFPDDSYVTGYVECGYIDQMGRAHHGRGWSLLRRGLYNESAGEWREALRLDPAILDQDIERLARRVGADPEVLDERLTLAHLLYVRGEDDAAVEHLRALIARSPDRAEAHWVVGLLCLSRDRWDEATVAFAEAMRLEPVYRVQRHLVLAEARYHLALAYRLSGLDDEARRELEEAARLDPANPLYRQEGETLSQGVKGGNPGRENGREDRVSRLRRGGGPEGASRS